MKKYLILLIIITSFFEADSQLIRPNPTTNFQQFGSPVTLTRINGLLYPAVGYAPALYADTAAMNATYLKNVPLAEASTIDGKTWRRNYACTKWEEFAIGSGSTPTWQQVLTAGSTLTGNNEIIHTGFQFKMTGGTTGNTWFYNQKSFLVGADDNGGNSYQFYLDPVNSRSALTINNSTTNEVGFVTNQRSVSETMPEFVLFGNTTAPSFSWGMNTAVMVRARPRQLYLKADSTIIDNLSNLAAQNRLIGQNSSNGHIGYTSIGTGLSLSSGSLAVSPSGLTMPINNLLAATGTNNIDNTTFAQTWNWTGVTTYGIEMVSSSTASLANSRILYVRRSGANASSSITTFAGDFVNGQTGTSSSNIGVGGTAGGGTTNYGGKFALGVAGTDNYGVYSTAITSGGTNNIGGYFQSANATNNYAIIVPASGGNVGIGTSTPAKIFHTVGTVRHETLGTASSDTTTNKPLGINSSGDVIPMTYWPGGAGGGITGSGTTNYLPKWTSSTALGNSPLYTSSGFTGIGTTTPNGFLDIVNNSSSTYPTYLGDITAYPFYLRNSNTTTASAALIAFGNGSDAYTSYFGAEKTTNSSDLVFGGRPTAGGTFVERIRIASSGNVGIGTTTTSHRLTIEEDQASQDVVKIRNLSSSGFASIGFFNSADSRTGGIGYGNASVSAPANDALYVFTNGKNIVFSKDVIATSSMNINSGGTVGITSGLYIGAAATTPTAALHIKAGTASANTGQLKLSLGLKQTTGEDGVLNYDSTSSVRRLIFDVGTTHKQIPLFTNATPGNGEILIGNGTDFTKANITSSDNTITITNGAGTINLSAKPFVDTGTYTPTLTNTTNITSSTAYLTHWNRIGNQITVWGAVDVTATSPGQVELRMSLPVTTANFNNKYDAAGNASEGTETTGGLSTISISPVTGTNVVKFVFGDGSSGVTRLFSFMFTYQYVAP